MFRHYLAVALRNVRSSPFASGVNVVTLAVGLVCFVTAYAASTFWSTAEQQFRNADDIYVLTVSVRNRQNGSGMQNITASPDVAAEALKTDYPAIAKIARAVVIDRKTMVANGAQAVRLFGMAVDPEFLDIFNLPFVAGDERSALSLPRSAVLTREAAGRLFGDGDPVGKTVVIGNSIDTTITGVIDAIPEPSQFGRSASAQLPFDMLASRDVYDALRANGGGPGFPGGALPPGAGWFMFGPTTYVYLPREGGLSAAALRPQLADFITRHVPEQMRSFSDMTLGLAPVRDVLGGTQSFFDTGLSFASVLLLLGGLVLGVACINYANLATARAARRVREIGVRKALGASPGQVAVQSFFEAGLLTLAALLVALAVFTAAQPLVKDLLGAELGSTFFASLRAWPALLALVIVVTFAAGAYPALVLSRVRPVSALAVAQARLGSAMFSTLLVGTQFAVASFLLIALTVISFQNTTMRRNAFSSIEDPLVLIENPTSMTKVGVDTLRERLSAVPQVRAVTEVMMTPWEGLFITVVKDSPDPQAAQRTAVTRQVGYDFFKVFNVPLLAGRVFDRAHSEDVPAQPPRPGLQVGGAGVGNSAGGASSGAQSSGDPPPPQNIVADRSFIAALGFATPEDAVDKLVYAPTPQFPPGAQPRPPMRIIGVVEDRSFSFFKLPDNTIGAMYALQADLGITVARVAASDLEAGLTNIDAAWKELAPNVAVSRRFLDEIFERAYATYVRVNHLFGTLSVMAFAICVAGLFGMAVFVAGRRRREIGVRKTLGGSTRQMIVLLLTGFSWPVLIANLVAWPAGYVAARLYLKQFSESVSITPLPFMLSAVITLVIACVAVLGQAVRAARTTPAEVLRNE
jgi:putative ABC transport system permease protein